MNKIERVVYDAVKLHPKVKLCIRNIYQTAFDLLPRKKDWSENPVSYKEGYFYGFHDTCPFSFDNSKVLANHVLIPLRMPKPGEGLEVGYFNFDGKELQDYVKLGDSCAWNYHKGCRLQWVDSNRVIFNTAIGGVMKSEIVSIDTKESRIIDAPIDTVSPDGRYATTFSYERLEKFMPGYGYPYKDDCAYLAEAAPADTGLFLVNLLTGERKLLVDLKTLSRSKDVPEEQRGYMHYVTHSEFSSDGRYVSFMHRWVGNEIRLRWTRLMIYDLQTGDCFALPTSGMVSHYVWRGHRILAYCRVKGIDSHVVFNVPDVENYTCVLTKQLNSDGHQTFVSDDVFVTDTYPDRRRMAKLFIVDMEKRTKRQILAFYHPKKFQSKLYKHICCDFHPCASIDGRFVCFDSAFTGKRSLCVMSLAGLL